MTTATITKHTLVIIDSAIDDHQILAQGILPTAEVIVLNKHQDGIAQISALCKNHPAVGIQIIAHGSPGNLQLGNSQLNLANLHTYRQQLQQWEAAEILIYGCEVAAGETGKTFIEQLHQLTGANIAASAQKIGNTQQGGTWELEVNIGQITSTLALQPEIREAYPGVFATFDTATNFTVGTSPYSVTVGDFNGDGKLDLAVANYSSATVSVLLGLGTGGFDTAINFTVGTSPYSVTVGDFNGDGKLDLATANKGSNNVSVLLGLGTGGFGTATNFSVGSAPRSVTVADFNNDGKLDLAVANSGSNNVSVLLGNGTGGFAPATNFTVGNFPRSVRVADFNSDGKLDLAVANYFSNTVSVLLGNGTGGFDSNTNFTVGTNPFSVTVGDFNGDGKLDLATANRGSNTVSVLLGLGTGGFGTATDFSVGDLPSPVTVGDFNGDGNLDLAAANFGNNTVSVLLGNGTGGFGTRTNFSVGSGTYSVTVGDFNGDGKLDLATANKGSNNVSVLLNTTPKITITAGTNPTEGGATGSFTITLETPAPVGGLVVNFNTTGSTATATTDYSLVTGANITAVTANTFTIAAGQTTATLAVTAVADGISDPNEKVTVNLESGPDYILGANSTANFQPVTNFSAGSSPRSVIVEDFNGDGKLDLAVANTTSGTVSVLLGLGTGGFATATNFSVGSSPYSVTVGDFNGDGKLDLAVANRDSNTVSVLLGNSTGGFDTATNFAVGSSPRAITVGDFNGDGKLDLAVANANSATVSVLLGLGTGGFGTAANFSVGFQPRSITVGNFNGDGKLDLAVGNNSHNNVSVLLGLGTGGFATATNFSVGSGPFSVAVGDFNGDGKLDLAVANQTSSNVSVLLGNGTGGFATATNFSVGSGSQSVTVGDFNGDGKLDLATANSGSKNVSVLLGDGTGGFGTATDFSVGTQPRSVTVGDFNGDGKLDLAVGNTGSNTISVLLNTNPNHSATLTIAESVSVAPVTTATNTPLPYTENDPPTAIDPGITVTDADSTNLSSATVKFTNGFVPAEDILAFTDPNNIITGSYTNGVLTLTGTATVAQYQTALRSVTYQNSSDSPSTTPRTISFVVNDGSLNSNPATRNINLTAVNDAPVTTATNTALTYTENESPTVIDSGITVTDADSTNLSSATVTITTGFAPTEDTLAFTNQNGITGTYTNGVLTLTGTATVAQYQTALRSVTYQNSSDNPSTTPRTISFVVNDGSLNSTAKTRNINITAVNDAPVATATNTALTYTENDPATAIDSGITVSDVDSQNLNSATVTITNGFVATEDSLAFTNQNDGITGSYSNGVLTLTGSATVAQYQTALQSVTYQNSSDNPSTSPRTISFVVNDGSLDSTAKTRDINLAAVNDAPTDLALSVNTVNDEAPANTIIGTFSSTDPDQNDNFAYSLVSGIDDIDNNAFTIDGNTLKINNSPDFKTKPSYKIRVRTTDNGSLNFEKGLTINVNDEIPSRLTNPDDDVFNITGQDDKATLEVKLTGHNSPLVNELGLFTVDDPQGTINGIAPGAEGYTQAAILRSEVILSAIANTPNGFDTNNLSRLLQLNSGQDFRFLLVQDGTLDAVRNDPNSIGKLLFSSVSTQKITDLGDNSFSLGWKDASGKSSTDFNDLVVKINQTDQALPLGTNLQGEFQGELIDLRDVQQSVQAQFNVYREASYNNYVGFYQVTDENGGIDTNGDGIADVLTGQAGYTQAAVRGKIAGIDLSVSNQGSATYNGVFQPGAIFAPFIIVNATPDAILDDNSSNDPAVYFPFLGANSDHTDHISLLASNTFGFEDLANGGDKDFNDLIIKVNLTTAMAGIT
ncbi:MAG: FG-GAP-like repeat-containing protein [Nostoc sp.]|uniref:FG-GAP-like repeat-containing protein n=2 Tax=Nostoc sp. TaxID=1180 RepID=UPI002FF90200